MSDTMADDLSIANDWFSIELEDEYGVRKIIEPYVRDWGGGCMWLIEGSEFCLLVETGIGIAPLRKFLETIVSKPIIAFASVGYYDHAGGLHQFDHRLIHKEDAHRIVKPSRHNTVADYYLDTAFDAKPFKNFNPNTYLMPASEPTRLLYDGDVIDIGNRTFEVLHLPGVTNGASGLYERESGLVFTGEAFVWADGYIYEGEPLDRSNDADLEAFKNSIRRLINLPAKAVYRGHYGRCEAKEMRSVGTTYLSEQRNHFIPKQ